MKNKVFIESDITSWYNHARKGGIKMINLIKRRLDAILHWNICFVGGFLGGYAILSHAGVFGSAQTGNLMEMASNVRFMEWEELGLRLLAMVIFACGVIASYMLTNYTNLHMRKLAIWVDAAGLGLTALLPDWFAPIAGVYPIFFCAAFQWGCIFRRGWFQQRDGLHHKQLQTIRPRLDAVCVDER